MTHQKELMKDWSLERQVEALSIVAPNLRLFMKYSSEELMALRQSNQDAFDLFVSIMRDQVDDSYHQKLSQLGSKTMNISQNYRERLYKIIVRDKYLELSLEAQDWIDNLLKASETNQVTNDILTWWWKGDIQKGNIAYLSDDKWNLSFLNRFKFWVTTIIMPICTGVPIPFPLRKDFDLFRKALTLASIFLVEKGWYEEIINNTTKE
jgi:hypothetical protein